MSNSSQTNVNENSHEVLRLRGGGISDESLSDSESETFDLASLTGPALKITKNTKKTWIHGGIPSSSSLYSHRSIQPNKKCKTPPNNKKFNLDSLIRDDIIEPDIIGSHSVSPINIGRSPTWSEMSSKISLTTPPEIQSPAREYATKANFSLELSSESEFPPIRVESIVLGGPRARKKILNKKSNRDYKPIVKYFSVAASPTPMGPAVEPTNHTVTFKDLDNDIFSTDSDEFNWAEEPSKCSEVLNFSTDSSEFNWAEESLSKPRPQIPAKKIRKKKIVPPPRGQLDIRGFSTLNPKSILKTPGIHRAVAEEDPDDVEAIMNSSLDDPPITLNDSHLDKAQFLTQGGSDEHIKIPAAAVEWFDILAKLNADGYGNFFIKCITKSHRNRCFLYALYDLIRVNNRIKKRIPPDALEYLMSDFNGLIEIVLTLIEDLDGFDPNSYQAYISMGARHENYQHLTWFEYKQGLINGEIMAESFIIKFILQFLKL